MPRPNTQLPALPMGSPGSHAVPVPPLQPPVGALQHYPAEIVSAIEELSSERELPPDAVRAHLATLQRVSWQMRSPTRSHEARHLWAELSPTDPRVQRMEALWRGTLWIAVTENPDSGAVRAISRRTGLDISVHPFCSQTGERHPQIPPDFFSYRRVVHLPDTVKAAFHSSVCSLVPMLRRTGSVELAIFATMVMTEVTSPKVDVDKHKAELAAAGAVGALHALLQAHRGVEAVAQNVCAVFRNILTNRRVMDCFEEAKCTPCIVECLNGYPLNTELVHRACGCLLIQASRGEGSRVELLRSGAIPCLVRVLQTPHGRTHMVRRLAVHTLQKIAKSVDKGQFRAAMDSVKGFTVLNVLRGLSNDDDRAGIDELLAARPDLPRGTLVDPTVLVIDEHSAIRREAIVQILRANEGRHFHVDPLTPKLDPLNPELVASPLFPSSPSFGGPEWEDDEMEDSGHGSSGLRRPSPTCVSATVSRARAPGACTAQSSLPDVALADDQLTAPPPQLTSTQIATPVTLDKIHELYAGAVAAARGAGRAAPPLSGAGPLVSEEQRVARDCLELLDRSFRPDGTFPRDKGFTQRLFHMMCSLTEEMARLLSNGPRGLVRVPAPCYVFGDIHGDFADLQYFMRQLLLFGDVLYTPYNFLFLGDYVDRGRWSVEVIAYLMALKVISPDSVTLLRGNHEDSDVCGDTAQFGAGCLKRQLMQCFQGAVAPQRTARLFDALAASFAHYPVAAIVAGRVFAVHGGIPRYSGGEDDRIATLSDPDFPPFRDFKLPAQEELTRETLEGSLQLRRWVYASDCIWSDPSAPGDALDQYGFGLSTRGGEVLCYGQQAVDSFLDAAGLDLIVRGHEEKADGLSVSKCARVVTVFSTSDYCGKGNRCGVALISRLAGGVVVCRMVRRARPLDKPAAFDAAPA